LSNYHVRSDWEFLSSPENTTLYGIYFSDINNGICGKYWTSNSGQSWTSSLIPYPRGYAFSFTEPNSGWCVGIGIYKTTNMGINWFEQTSPTGSNLYAVDFVNNTIGYACGLSNKIIKTTNGGNNWTLLPAPPASDYYDLYGISFTDANSGFVAGYTTSGFQSVILKTTNGGLNWSVQNFPYNSGFSAISFVNSTTGIVIGLTSAKTTNAGISWIPKTLPTGGWYGTIFFTNINTGYSVGYNGIILKTINSGESWFQQTSPTNSILQSVYFMNENTGFACGNNGVIIKTTDGGGPPIGINLINNEIPFEYSLSQNYPNPFNPVTKIKFSVPKTGVVKLTVYDAAGRVAAALFNGELSAGTYNYDFDASQLASGIYFYKLESNDFSQTKKMVLIK
jgi:photosystem II stability/assembly factor-like uncharacterized protein